MKKHFVIASSLISQMVHLGHASAQSVSNNLHDQLTNYLNEEAQKPAAGSSVKTYQGNSTIVLVKKLRSPFRHISKNLFAAKMNVTSSSDVQPSTPAPTSSSEDSQGPSATSSSGPVSVGPTSSTSNPPPPVTSSSDSGAVSQGPTSSSEPTPPPPTSSSGICRVVAPMKAKNFINTYRYQVVLTSNSDHETANKAYYFANKIRQSENTIVYRVFQFSKMSDLSHSTAQAYMVVNPKTNRVSFSRWTK